MFVYLLVQWLEMVENSSSSGKSQTDVSWKSGKEKCIELLHIVMESQLFHLWDPPSVAMMDDLAALVGTGCYKVLENASIVKEKVLLERTVHLLGILVCDYRQGLGKDLSTS